jgi:osmoprotectant transport system substrate-binding protein
MVRKPVGASPWRWRAASFAAVLAVVVTADGGCRAQDVPPAPSPRHRAVVVASFDFPESDLLAEIYAQALDAAGVPVRRERNLGPRELVLPALQQGLVDVVPEYLGTALTSLAPGSRANLNEVTAVRSALDAALRPWGLRSLEPATASDQNGLVVTRATAARFGLRTVSDLADIAGRLTFAGTPECATRQYCLVGLRRVYGLRFHHFVPLATEAQRAAALTENGAGVALMFTTDGRLASGDLVLLRDDKNLQPAENLVPVVSTRVVERYGDLVVRTLNRVSAQLTPENLLFLNWRVGVDGKNVDDEAGGWLQRHGLLTPAEGT